MNILVTGAAGFIGGHVAEFLGSAGHKVLGVDNFSPYYSPQMKRKHVSTLLNFDFQEADVNQIEILQSIFESFKPEIVIHLAAQGGVRASRENPIPYLTTNQIGFLNVLDQSEKYRVKKFIYASSSSVYGEGLIAPFKEDSLLPSPKSLYALSKVSNEIIAKNYPTHGMERIGLRFFTVYGPWGRPDMAVFRLLASASLGKEFTLTANMDVMRDFTFVSDVSQCIFSIVSTSHVLLNEVFNVAGSSPHSMSELFEILQGLGINPRITKSVPDSMDVKLTHGSVDKLRHYSLSVPSTDLTQGLMATLTWLNTVSPEELGQWLEYSTK